MQNYFTPNNNLMQPYQVTGGAASAAMKNPKLMAGQNQVQQIRSNYANSPSGIFQNTLEGLPGAAKGLAQRVGGSFQRPQAQPITKQAPVPQQRQNPVMHQMVKPGGPQVNLMPQVAQAKKAMAKKMQ